MTPKTALIAGGTELVGGHCLRLLSAASFGAPTSTGTKDHRFRSSRRPCPHSSDRRRLCARHYDSQSRFAESLSQSGFYLLEEPRRTGWGRRSAAVYVGQSSTIATTADFWHNGGLRYKAEPGRTSWGIIGKRDF